MALQSTMLWSLPSLFYSIAMKNMKKIKSLIENSFQNCLTVKEMRHLCCIGLPFRFWKVLIHLCCIGLPFRFWKVLIPLPVTTHEETIYRRTSPVCTSFMDSISTFPVQNGNSNENPLPRRHRGSFPFFDVHREVHFTIFAAAMRSPRHISWLCVFSVVFAINHNGIGSSPFGTSKIII